MQICFVPLSISWATRSSIINITNNKQSIIVLNQTNGHQFIVTTYKIFHIIMNLSCYHKTLKRWSLQLGKALGFQISPKTIFTLAVAIVLILLIQISMYIIFNSRTIYCKLPNIRFRYNDHRESYEKLPTIYVVTPTYARYVQKAELTRLSHTLMLVPNLHWIIVEDSDWATDLVRKFVIRLKNEFDFHTITRLHSPTPESFKLKPGQASWSKPKGVWQRNKALEWIRDNLSDLDSDDGVIYFADDDNTYDVELFNEMRYTRRVSVWPVGFVGGLLVERPIVDPEDGSRIKEFNSMWQNRRPFPIDMAGFAISLRLLISHPEAKFSDEQRIGYVESHFLGQLVSSWDELEPKADRCSKILVWHTQTKKPTLHEERKLAKPSHSEIEW